MKSSQHLVLIVHLWSLQGRIYLTGARHGIAAWCASPSVVVSYGQCTSAYNDVPGRRPERNFFLLLENHKMQVILGGEMDPAFLQLVRICTFSVRRGNEPVQLYHQPP